MNAIARTSATNAPTPARAGFRLARTLSSRVASMAERLKLSSNVLLFCAFSCAGWIYETVDNVFAFGGFYLRAQFMLPWCPIYGIGGLIIVALMEPLRRRLRDRVPLALQVALIAICIYGLSTAIELAGSYACECLMGYVPWDYSHAWGNFQGRIAPAYTARFVVLGLVALYALLPAITRFAAERPRTARRLALLLVAALVGDYALQSAGMWDGAKDALGAFGIRHW